MFPFRDFTHCLREKTVEVLKIFGGRTVCNSPYGDYPSPASWGVHSQGINNKNDTDSNEKSLAKTPGNPETHLL